ncbi:MAG: response regulator transcription factor [Candidatus Dormiibacterota bacterium]
MAKTVTAAVARQRAKLPRILVVEANPGYRSVISHVVELAGGQFQSVAELADVQHQLETRKFDLLIIGMSADSRATPKQVADLHGEASCPIILLDESFGDAGEALGTYEAGANQVLPKPFVPDVLMGAIKSVLRGPDSTSVVSIATRIEMGGLVFDAKHRTVKGGGSATTLTKREWQLLSFFLSNPHQFFTAEEVAVPAWGPDASIEQFRTYVTRLRRKLSPFKAVCEVVSEKGKGYRLVLGLPRPPPP